MLVVFGVICGASSGIFGVAITAPSAMIGFGRLTIAVPLFLIPVLTNYREELKSLDKKEIGLSLLAGAFLFAHFFSWYNAVKMTNIASAVTLAALHPLVVLALTVFVLKKHVGVRPILGIVLALLGGVMVAGLDQAQLSAGNFTGDILAFAAGTFMGIYFVLGNVVRKTVSGPVYVFLCFFGCWICFIICMIVTKTPVTGYPARDYLLIILLTIVCQIGAHALMNMCMGYVDSLYVSAWESGECAFAIVMSLIFLRQVPTSWEVLGSVIVMIGLLYYNYHTGVEEKKRLKS